MKAKRDQYYQVRLSAAEKGALRQMAMMRDCPVSQIVRQAIRTVTAEARTSDEALHAGA